MTISSDWRSSPGYQTCCAQRQTVGGCHCLSLAAAQQLSAAVGLPVQSLAGDTELLLCMSGPTPVAPGTSLEPVA